MPHNTELPVRVDVAVSLHPDALLLELRAERELRLFRISVCALFAVLFLTAAWFVPWGFFGMRVQDLDGPTTLGIVLLVAAGAASTAFSLRWAPMLMQEPKSELVRALLGEGMRIRSESRFLTRLRHQCDLRLKDRGPRFSLLVIELPGIEASPGGTPFMTQAFAAVRRIVRGNDVVGDSGGHEIWVLLLGAGLGDCDSVRGRLAAALQEDVDELHRTTLPPRIGAGAFETDGRDADALFRAARSRAAASSTGDADAA